MPRQTLYDGYFQLIKTDELGRDRCFLQTSDSVCLLLYVKDKQQVILIQQPRETMIRPDNPDGYIIELVAGRFDCDMSVIELAIKEAWEESRATVRPEQIEVLNDGQPMATCAGGLTERTYLCYAAIHSDQLGPDQTVFSAEGEDERIGPRVVIPIAALNSYVCEDLRVFAAMKELQVRLLRQREQEK